ncbi:hypothetical protein H5410_044581 [Solanum commersonii]|uniref:Uncharacterized protein n=1 Tax=Solanum commersonii TaxID=4109 RepID=A0A9J5X7E6_SOLCO|nr:hypothetical protein H5410_044581 [Solanum commersonii]
MMLKLILDILNTLLDTNYERSLFMWFAGAAESRWFLKLWTERSFTLIAAQADEELYRQTSVELFIVNFFCAQHHNPHFTLSYCILNDANMKGVFSRIEHKNVNMLCCNISQIESKEDGMNTNLAFTQHLRH